MHQRRSLKQERARLAAGLRRQGKTRVQIAEAFRDRYGVNARVALRWARGWTQREATERWCEHWPDDPKTAQNLSYWETWPQSGHAPSLHVLDRLAQLYECDIADLVVDLPGYRHLDPVGTEPQPRAPEPVPPPTGITLLSDSTPTPAGTTTLDIAAVRAMSDAFRAADRRCGGGVLYDSLVRYLNGELAPHLLAPADQTLDSQIYAAAASLTEAAGWMAHDGGHDTRARQHLTRAFKLASIADNNPLVANICASMSHLAGQLGQAHEAVRLADKGLDQIGQRTDLSALRARLHAMRALGLAGQNEPRPSVRALRDAERSLDRDTTTNAEWLSHFDEGSLASETATCLRRLGDLTQAEAAARHAIALRDGDRIRSRALALVTLAEVLIDAERIDEAAHIGLDVCEMAHTLASNRVTQRLTKLHAAITEHPDIPAVRDFTGALAEIQHAHGTTTVRAASWPT